MSKCEIMTKSGDAITFHMRLKSIEYDSSEIYYCDLNPLQMFDLAKQYKECGVKMSRKYPLFAHNYFSLAAKCLLSFNHFQPGELDEKLSHTEVKKKDFDELLQVLYSNIALFLIKQKRYDQVISLLGYVKSEENPKEKAAHRLATAYFHLRDYQEAEEIIKKVENYKSNKHLALLLEKVQKMGKAEKEKLSNLAKKMLFG
jgi:tetratricopeptide (TPR) repeat protein